MITEKISIAKADEDKFDMMTFENRRFMYNPKTGTIVFGKDGELNGSHGAEFGITGCDEAYDDFVRGWIGVGKEYPHGVIHFAPNIPPECVWLFERGFDTLEMFSAHGAGDKCIIRGFGKVWEQPLGSIKGEQK